MKKTRLLSLLVVMALIVQLFSAMTLSVSAAQYGKIGEYVSTAWNGRAFDTAFAQFNGKTYAYVGTVNAGGAGGGNSGGIAVLDITNPATMKQVQIIEDGSIFLRDSAQARDRLYVKDDCLYVLNGANAQLQIFRINPDNGTFSTSAIWSSGQISVQGVGSLKVVGNLMFVATYYTNASTVRIYDISDSDSPALLSTDTPIYPTMLTTGDYNTTNCSQQIGTYSIDVEDKGNGVYRVYGTNRAKFNSGAEDRYFLSIRDITVSGNTYTVNTLYEGQPTDTSFATGNGWAVYDVAVINANTIAIADGYTGNADKTLQIIDVSTPSAPVFAVANDDNHEGLDVYSDGEIIAIAKKASGTNVYTYDSTTKTLTKAKGIAASSWACDIGVYSGFMYITGHSAFSLYEYKTGISIDNADVKAIGGKITGTVEGLLSGDTVNVTVGAKSYVAEVSGSKFTASIDELEGTTVNVTATLTRGGSQIATVAKTLTVVTLGNKVYNDLSAFSTKAIKNIAVSTGGRYTDAIGMYIAGKKLVYAYTSAGLEILDITDIENVSVTTNTAIKGNNYNSQMQIKNGYVIVVNCNNGRKVEFYKINADGSVAETPTAIVGGNTDASKVTTIEIVDNYLFEAQQGGNQTMNIYDISDIAGGVKSLGNIGGSYGIHGAEIQKISDTVYRAYYVSRNNSTGWSFCINDITISNGTVTYEEKYHGNVMNFSNAAEYSGVKDIEYLGNNKLYLAIDNGVAYTGLILMDVTNPTSPVATGTAGRAVTAESFGTDYYAVAQGGALNNIKIYDADDTLAKEFNTSSQIYNISEFDGKMLVSTKDELCIYDGLYSGIEVDESAIEIASSVKIPVRVYGYETGDRVTVTVNGVEHNASVDEDGNFYYSYSPMQPETVSVTASLIRNSEVILTDAGEIDIVNEYSTLPEFIVDTEMTVLSTSKPVDAASAEIWGSANRATSVAIAEIGGKDIAYVISYNNIMVYDITNPQAPVLLQNNAIALGNAAYSKRAEVYNGYLYVVNQRTICAYKINSDGKLDLNTVTTENIGVDIDGFTIVDNYMFVSLRTSAGIVVYDVSDSADIVSVGQHGVVSRTQALTVEKVGNIYRAYFIEREGSVYNLGIYDISISGGKATFTQRYKGDILTCSEKSSIAQIVKVDEDTIATGETYAAQNMDLINVADPSNPYIEISKGSVRFQSGSAVADGYFVYGAPDGTAILYSTATNTTKSFTLGVGQVYETELYKGNLVFVCAGGLVISSAVTYTEIDNTTLKGSSPKLSGKVVNFNSTTDRLLVSVNNGAAQVVAVNNGKFEVSLGETLTDAGVIGVQLVIERQGENAAGKYYAVNYLGESPYSITNVTNTDGVKITVKKNYDTDDTCTVYVASYTGDALAAVDMIDIEEGTLTSDIAFNSQTQTLKIFVWNQDLVPVTEVLEPTFAEVGPNF